MNELKKALHDVAGDMSESERAVKNAVLYNKKRKRKMPLLIVPTIVIIILTIGIAFWAVPKGFDQLSAQNPINESLYTYYMEFQKLSWNDGTDEQYRYDAYMEMLQTLGIIEYAKSIGLKATDEDYADLKESLQFIEDSYEVFPFESLAKKEYKNNVLPILQEKAIYQNLLKNKWYETFPVMTDSIAQFYSNRKAIVYMEEQYEKQLAYFKEQQQIKTLPSSSFTSLPKTGVVAAVNDNVFYFMQNKVAQELDEIPLEQFQTTSSTNNGSLNAWIINDESVSLQVGDYVKLTASGWNTEESNGEIVTLALPDSIEVLQRQSDGNNIEEVTLNIEDSLRLEELLKSAKWEANSLIRIYSDLPYYIVHTKITSYKIWKTSQRRFYIMPFGEDNFTQLTQVKTSELEQILDKNKTK